MKNVKFTACSECTLQNICDHTDYTVNKEWEENQKRSQIQTVTQILSGTSVRLTPDTQYICYLIFNKLTGNTFTGVVLMSSMKEFSIAEWIENDPEALSFKAHIKKIGYENFTLRNAWGYSTYEEAYAHKQRYIDHSYEYINENPNLVYNLYDPDLFNWEIEMPLNMDEVNEGNIYVQNRITKRKEDATQRRKAGNSKGGSKGREVTIKGVKYHSIREAMSLLQWSKYKINTYLLTHKTEQLQAEA